MLFRLICSDKIWEASQCCVTIGVLRVCLAAGDFWMLCESNSCYFLLKKKKKEKHKTKQSTKPHTLAAFLLLTIVLVPGTKELTSNFCTFWEHRFTEAALPRSTMWGWWLFFQKKIRDKIKEVLFFFETKLNHLFRVLHLPQTYCYQKIFFYILLWKSTGLWMKIVKCLSAVSLIRKVSIASTTL